MTSAPTRRALVLGGLLASTAMVGSAVAGFRPAANPDPETAGLEGLPLAAVHIDRAVQSMADFHFGKWEVTIRSGEPEQVWCFRQLAAHDPLLDAISAYREGNEAFNGTPDGMTPEEEEVQIEATYGPPMRVLEAWNKPARSHAGAVAALRLAVSENAAFMGSEISENMVRAALGYLDPAQGGAKQ